MSERRRGFLVLVVLFPGSVLLICVFSTWSNCMEIDMGRYVAEVPSAMCLSIVAVLSPAERDDDSPR